MKIITAGASTLTWNTDIGRLLLTACIVGGVVGLNMLAQHHVMRGKGTPSQRRVWSTWAKNLFWGLGILLVGGVWASKIAGFALSVAALAAAILIVSKELVACLLGTAYLALVRPFTVGDYVEIGPTRGQVLSTNPFSITLSLAAEANQITGKTVSIPSSQVLVTPVVNFSATGAFAMFLMRVHPPQDVDLLNHEEFLLRAAEDICGPWQDEADALFIDSERVGHMDLPSAAPRVLYDLSDPKHSALVVRFTCEPRLRVRTEQAILRKYLLLCRDAQEVKNKLTA